ncbi:MAG: hypothetical protein CBR30_09510 [Dictyoglomus sp. NZ13-RE01]|nr:MAG: hypothetical protein CBR30_09510 [Dictyoglomus sp. NZ13-RE01]
MWRTKNFLLKGFTLFFLALFLLTQGFGASSKVQIRFTFWGGKEEKTAYEAMIKAFNDSQNEIEVIPVHIPDMYEEKVLTMIGAGDVPDIIAIGGAHIPAFAARGALSSLDNYISRINTAAYYRKALDAMYWDKKLYGLPFRMNTKLMAYNLDMLNEAGIQPPSPGKAWTPEEYLANAKKLTIPGKRWGSGFPWWNQWLYQFGGRVLDREGKRCMLNRPEALESLKYVYDLVWVHGAAPKPEETGGMGPIDMFMAEKVAMFCDVGPYFMPILTKITKFKWGLALQPGKGNFGGSGEMEVVGLAIPAKAPNPEAAFTAITFLTADPRAQDILALTKTQIPGSKRSGSLFAKQFPGAELFIKAIDLQEPQFKSPDSRAIGRVLDELRDSVLTSFNPKSPEVALKEACEKINKILKGGE